MEIHTSQFLGILSAVLLTAFGLSIRLANVSTRLKNAEHDLDALRSEISSLQHKHQQALDGINKAHEDELKEYNQQLQKLKKQITHYTKALPSLSDMGRELL
ncbi:MAG: hypothetical protein R3E73_00015 [Porticoccaceae bacterium]|nr:hypothetical protein [Pseudomonadales bacterium]MCP5171608.1 hypothetical protein [Pseudomonadales bacterium]